MSPMSCTALAVVPSHQTSPSTRTRPVAVRQSGSADAVSTSAPIELAKVLALTTGPKGLWRWSSACTSRALQSFITNQPPTAAFAPSGVASAIGRASTQASSSSKSRYLVWRGPHLRPPPAPAGGGVGPWDDGGRGEGRLWLVRRGRPPRAPPHPPPR